MSYIVIHCEQGSDEWHKARAGVITASMFKIARQRVGLLTDQQQAYVDAIRRGQSEDEAIKAGDYKSKPKRTETVQRAINGLPVGDFSDAAKNYAFRLAVERISGVPLDEGFSTWQMKRGQELEPAARQRHEEEAGVIVVRAGFVTTSDGAFGASADGFIEEDDGSEYKCLVSPEGLREILLNDDISEFTDQVHGCMWITGRKRWHFGLYCPALASIGADFTWRVIERDDDYIEAMEIDLMDFKGLVDQYHAKLLSFKANPIQITQEDIMTDTQKQDELSRQYAELERAETQRLANLNAALIVEAPAAVIQAAVEMRDATADIIVLTGDKVTVPTAKPDTAPTMKLWMISEKLGFNVTAEFLRSLGFEPAGRERAAILYHADDFEAIGQALIEHIESVLEGVAA